LFFAGEEKLVWSAFGIGRGGTRGIIMKERMVEICGKCAYFP
jgi:hypothetical protein